MMETFVITLLGVITGVALARTGTSQLNAHSVRSDSAGLANAARID